MTTAPTSRKISGKKVDPLAINSLCSECTLEKNYFDNVTALVALTNKLSYHHYEDILLSTMQVLKKYRTSEKESTDKITFLEGLTAWILCAIDLHFNVIPNHTFINNLATELKTSMLNSKSGIFLYYCHSITNGKADEHRIVNSYNDLLKLFNESVNNGKRFSFYPLNGEMADCWDACKQFYSNVKENLPQFSLPPIFPDKQIGDLNISECYVVSLIRNTTDLNKTPINIERKGQDISCVSFGLKQNKKKHTTVINHIKKELKKFNIDNPQISVIISTMLTPGGTEEKSSASVRVILK